MRDEHNKLSAKPTTYDSLQISTSTGAHGQNPGKLVVFRHRLRLICFVCATLDACSITSSVKYFFSTLAGCSQ